MSSITKDTHKPPKSPFWIACYNGIGTDGKIQRFKRSTKTTDAKLARRMADEFEQLAKQEGEKRLTETQCRKVISQMFQRIIGEPLHFRSCRLYLTEWLEGVKSSVDESTWRCYKTSISGFLEHLAAKAEQQLQDIPPTVILQWRNKMTASGLSAPTVNGHLKVLRIPFKRAHDLGYIPVNVCGPKAVPPVRDVAEDVEKDVFTSKQVSELIEASPSEDWRGMIIMAYFSGLRLHDCSELRWNDLDLDKQIIKIKPHKTRRHGTTVVIPIHPQFSVAA